MVLLGTSNGIQNGLNLATIFGLTENEELPSATSSQNYWPNQKINQTFVQHSVKIIERQKRATLRSFLNTE